MLCCFGPCLDDFESLDLSTYAIQYDYTVSLANVEPNENVDILQTCVCFNIPQKKTFGEFEKAFLCTLCGFGDFCFVREALTFENIFPPVHKPPAYRMWEDGGVDSNHWSRFWIAA